MVGVSGQHLAPCSSQDDLPSKSSLENGVVELVALWTSSILPCNYQFYDIEWAKKDVSEKSSHVGRGMFDHSN